MSKLNINLNDENIIKFEESQTEKLQEDAIASSQLRLIQSRNVQQQKLIENQFLQDTRKTPVFYNGYNSTQGGDERVTNGYLINGQRIVTTSNIINQMPARKRPSTVKQGAEKNTYHGLIYLTNDIYQTKNDETQLQCLLRLKNHFSFLLNEKNKVTMFAFYDEIPVDLPTEFMPATSLTTFINSNTLTALQELKTNIKYSPVQNPQGVNKQTKTHIANNIFVGTINYDVTRMAYYLVWNGSTYIEQIVTGYNQPSGGVSFPPPPAGSPAFGRIYILNSVGGYTTSITASFSGISLSFDQEYWQTATKTIEEFQLDILVSYRDAKTLSILEHKPRYPTIGEPSIVENPNIHNKYFVVPLVAGQSMDDFLNSTGHYSGKYMLEPTISYTNMTLKEYEEYLKTAPIGASGSSTITSNFYSVNFSPNISYKENLKLVAQSDFSWINPTTPVINPSQSILNAIKRLAVEHGLFIADGTVQNLITELGFNFDQYNNYKYKGTPIQKYVPKNIIQGTINE